MRYTSLNEKFNNPMYKTAGFMDSIGKLFGSASKAKPKVPMPVPSPYYQSSKYLSGAPTTPRQEELSKLLHSDVFDSLSMQQVRAYQARENLRKLVHDARSSGSLADSAEAIANAKKNLRNTVQGFDSGRDMIISRLANPMHSKSPVTGISRREVATLVPVNQEYDQALRISRR